MKRNTLIAVGVLAVLVVALLVVMNSGDDNAPAPIAYAVPALKAPATRVEITEGGTTVVLQREASATPGGSNTWRIVKPIDFPVAEQPAKALDALLDKGFGTDRTLPEGSDVNKYELGESAPVIAVYEGDALKAKFKVGKESVVEETYVKRTWILPDGATTIHRAQAGLKTDLVKKLDDWRERSMTSFEEPNVTGFTLTYGSTSLSFERAADAADFTLKAPAGIQLDAAAVKRLVAAAGRLRAAGFGDSARVEDTGLDAPVATLTFTFKEDKPPLTLLLGKAAPPDAPPAEGKPPAPANYYVQIKDKPVVYTLQSYTYDSLNKRLGDLRNKEMTNVELTEVERVTFPPPSGATVPLVVAREGAGWKLQQPEVKDLDTNKVEATLRVLTKLRAKDIPDTTAEAAGLVTPARRVEIALKGGAALVINLGNATGDDGKDLFARVGDDGLIFTIPSWNATRLSPLLDDLLPGGEPPPTPGGLPPGFPGGGIPGMPGGLPPGFNPHGGG